MSNTKVYTHVGSSLELYSPTKMPLASTFLWNPHMMIQVNCRGYATAQFMQPEPAKYAYAPNLEAQTFMQPEQPYYAHHPGRFFYVKDQATGHLFSAPYEPVRSNAAHYTFTASQDAVAWTIIENEIQVELRLSLCRNRAAELWQTTVRNLSDIKKDIAFTPYFPVGYMSWMNQSADFSSELNAIICRSVTPYQKYPDYYKNQNLKDLTYFLAETKPNSWETRQSQFEGEGGLHNPSALLHDALSNSDAIYETPTAALQYRLALAPLESRELKFAFGPAKDEAEIKLIRKELFRSGSSFNTAVQQYSDYVAQAKPRLTVNTPDEQLNDFVNHWLSRQIFYHGDVNRLSTDPQTRNYLQDNMGMSYVEPTKARASFITALQQQCANGSMPDGILLHKSAELKYINQVPHMDHCIWLPICISAYIEETNDIDFFDQQLSFGDSEETASIAEHIDRALEWIFEQRDHRGLNYIAQGDWCDPMNMVGHKGLGVSSWLTLATAYASNTWATISKTLGRKTEAQKFRSNAEACNLAVNTHTWCGEWYGRGITDDGRLFGTPKDKEGAIFLNPQAWAILSGAANEAQQAALLNAVQTRLDTPFGTQMLAPAFTSMREDIGRVTQKHPGSAENGSVYNHAAAFYVYALYDAEKADQAYDTLRKMIPSQDQSEILQRGQLPVFIPNYYRGAYQQFPRTAGRSSQLFNTGTVHWFMRCLIDGMFGVKGCMDGLMIQPQLPSHWPCAEITRHFRGAKFTITYQRNNAAAGSIKVDQGEIQAPLIENIEAGKYYSVTAYLSEH